MTTMMYAQAIKRKIGDNQVMLSSKEAAYTAIDLSAAILKTLFKDAIRQSEDFFPAGIVVSVPYYFKQHQHDNLLLALKKALKETFSHSRETKIPKILGLLPEPIAAALYYVLNETTSSTINERNVMVFDMGGGTLDITLFRLSLDAVRLHFEILSNDGHPNFGGEDFDEVLMAYMVEKEEVNFEGLSEKVGRFKEKTIRKAVKKAKEDLSFNKEASIITPNLPGNHTIDVLVKRAVFEQLLSGHNVLHRNFGKEVTTSISNCLVKGRLKKEEVDLVLLIGSSSQIPYFQNLLKKSLKNATFVVREDFLKYAVVKGSALYAAYLLDRDFGHNHQAFGKGIHYEDCKIVFKTPHHLGIEKQKGQLSIIIPSNSKVPARKTKVFVPTAYADASRKKVKLDSIKICQGNPNGTNGAISLGLVDRLPTIYTHGRALQDIKIEVDFEATETRLSAHITIPNGNINGEDISLHTNISMVNH